MAEYKDGQTFGRPKKEFDWSKLDAVMQYGALLKDVASVMDCSDQTIINKIRDKYDCTFLEYRSKRMANVKLTLVQKAIKMAQDGNTTMMIFCLKNLAGWADKQETTVTETTKERLEVSKVDAEA